MLSSPKAPTTTPPPPTPTLHLAFPRPHLLLATLARPQALNALPSAAHAELDALWRWYDDEPSLRAAVITGAGTRAFCAGADLVEQGARVAEGKEVMMGGAGGGGGGRAGGLPASGFGGLSQRTGKKVVVAAVNGLAMGGGLEMVLNCDIAIASPTATFALPEAQHGLYAAAGGLARLVHTIGMPLASEMALAGRVLRADEALRSGLINRVATSAARVVEEALDVAARVAEAAPDAVVVSRRGLRAAWETGSVEEAAKRVEGYAERLWAGDNLKEGLRAFGEKRKPVWRDSKL